MNAIASELTDRQKDVLDTALALLVEAGDAFTMAQVARRASCSKETLYKWFGDRDGLLTAMVRWQASRVRFAATGRENLDAASLAASLEEFAANWLKVLTGKTSIALNRVAVASARAEERTLGDIVLENGPFAMAKRLKPLLELGREKGLLVFEDADTAFRSFFGLVIGDVQIRLLLGDKPNHTDDEIRRDARRATEFFFALYGADQGPGANKAPA
ncbi:MAG: TetR family transcriptional regulator [Hyphomicrobiales bacterium]|mgnify:CR=1 FL=1|nr:MAG: TetR family transcriptional regulator [Hyphomicrobiales bacterium]